MEPEGNSAQPIPSTVPLIRALSEAGLGSRRTVADAILKGEVLVNGVKIGDLRFPVCMDKDRILVAGRPVELRRREVVCLMLNKPAGVLSTTRDERGRRTVFDILPPQYRSLGLHPAGRLDKDSTGLLILTNDGGLTHRITHPRFEHEKEYFVSIAGRLSAEQKRMMEQGVRLEEGVTQPAVVRSLKGSGFSYSITLREGRKRQVRRMFLAAGHRVLALKRVRIGRLHLGDLKEGSARELDGSEISSLLDAGN